MSENYDAGPRGAEPALRSRCAMNYPNRPMRSKTGLYRAQASPVLPLFFPPQVTGEAAAVKMRDSGRVEIR